MLSAELYLLWPMSFPLSGCSLEMYSSPQSLVSLGGFHTVDGRCTFDCPSVVKEGLRLSSVSMVAPAMTNSYMDLNISVDRLCYSRQLTCIIIHLKYWKESLKHSLCFTSFVALIYKHKCRTRFALFQHLFLGQIRSKIRHVRKEKTFQVWLHFRVLGHFRSW